MLRSLSRLASRFAAPLTVARCRARPVARRRGCISQQHSPCVPRSFARSTSRSRPSQSFSILAPAINQQVERESLDAAAPVSPRSAPPPLPAPPPRPSARPLRKPQLTLGLGAMSSESTTDSIRLHIACVVDRWQQCSAKFAPAAPQHDLPPVAQRSSPNRDPPPPLPTSASSLCASARPSKSTKLPISRKESISPDRLPAPCHGGRQSLGARRTRGQGAAPRRTKSHRRSRSPALPFCLHLSASRRPTPVKGPADPVPRGSPGDPLRTHPLVPTCSHGQTRRASRSPSLRRRR